MLPLTHCLALSACLITAPLSLATAFFPVNLDVQETAFARAARSMGFQLDATNSQGDTHHYKNLATGWDAKVELANGKVTSYTVSAPYDAKYPVAAKDLKRLLGTPWREGDEQMAWLVPDQAITTFKKSWLYYEVKTLSLASSAGRDLKASASDWSAKAATSGSATPMPRTVTAAPNVESAAKRDQDTQQAALKAEQQRRAVEGPFTDSQVQRMCAERIRALDSNVRTTVSSMDDRPRRMRMYKLADWKYLPRMWVDGPTGKYKQRYECTVQDDGTINVEALQY